MRKGIAYKMENKQIITSRQNPFIKFVCGLSDKKKRAESGQYRFDGIKLLYEAVDAGVDICHVIYREDAEARIHDVIRSMGARAVAVSGDVFGKMTEEKSPEGVITVARMSETLHRRVVSCDVGAAVDGRERILMAEAIRDPGNLGTVIRSCYALGIDKLVLSSDCADLYNPKTIRAAMGAIFRLPTVTVDSSELSCAVKTLVEQGRSIYAADLHGESRDIATIQLRAGDCFVIGNEGHGLCDATVRACTHPVIIPMREGAESLNASAAAAICIWETVRAR
jgi:TrmH family RNA methyltransferase